MQNKRKNNQLTSPRSVGMWDINALLHCAPISRIKTLRDDEGRRAFTLIELLVVVLIIGILAAVAVPQYQKAVYKARALEIISFVNALEKGIDIYALERNLQGTTFFMENGVNELDIDLSSFITCGYKDGHYCHANSGKWFLEGVSCAYVEGDTDKCTGLISDSKNFDIGFWKGMDDTWFKASCNNNDLATPQGKQFCAVFNTLTGA